MRSVSAAELMELFDLGEPASPMLRAVLLLSAVSEAPDEDVAARPLGRVNADLLRLRARLFGRALECLANCPRCDALCECPLDCERLAHLDVRETSPVFSWQGESLRLCLPTVADVIAVSRGADAANRLAARILPAQSCETLAGAEAEEALLEAALAADPLARINLDLSCPDCGARWAEPFFPIDVLWTELRAFISRLVGEVARLARAFGWREADILAMSASRRRRYLELAPA